MKPIEGSKTSAFKTQMPGNYPKENILHKEHGESLKSRKAINSFQNSDVILKVVAFLYVPYCLGR
jgi:hypothetical protein